ncbi:uncharacterized protein [Montipora foliosa]|uniref:uncharacterized protein n=1 Tax=Montipora foliosa TaxID=591990 RepID=UPI0035F181D8
MADEELASEIEKVFTFLREKRKVDFDVCDRFRKEMRWNRWGKNEERSEKKRKLLELSKQLVKKPSKGKAKTQETPSSKERKHPQKSALKKTQVGWHHYNEDLECHVYVRLAKGGGTRELMVPLSATEDDMIDLLTNVSFPEGYSVHGYTHELKLKLADFKFAEVIGDEFTSLSCYIAKYNLSKVKMYLLSRCVDDDEAVLLTPAFESKQNTSTSSTPSTGLLGSSEERAALKDIQLIEYLDSLEKDQAKECAAQEQAREEHVQARQEELLSLRSSRAQRVPAEPDVCEPHITVSVRHVSLGIHTPRFPKRSDMTCCAIYDWVGSLSLTPQYFTLSSFSEPVVNPSLPVESVDRLMLAMAEFTEAPAYPDEEVLFQGFGENPADAYVDYPLNATVPDLNIICETPPPFLMANDEM